MASPCLCGKLQNVSFSKVSFCVAGVALRDILTSLKKRRKSFSVTGEI